MELLAAMLSIALLSVGAEADLRAPPERPRVGIALGGGSAKGIAHIGVLRWLEEHRVPIDYIAGTSMGGLVAGAYAAGLSADELSALVRSTDWDEMFGGSAFRYKNLRRKADARAYPSRLEFGVRRGVLPPTALNDGAQVDELLAGIAAGYGELDSFDDLPTPFRCVAVDLVRGEGVVLDRGHVQHAMRATMSIPGVFPPVEDDGRLLVDGGALNNVPADVARGMGADVVIAVRLGTPHEGRVGAYSILGVASATLDVMMDVNTSRALASADIVITPALSGFGRLDWRRARELEEAGYRAAEAMRSLLLPLAVDSVTWAALRAARAAARAPRPVPAAVVVTGADARTADAIRRALAGHVGAPLDAAALARDLAPFRGLDRYASLGWQIDRDSTGTTLQIRAVPKIHAPPYLMLRTRIENTTTEFFTFQLAARYLRFDVVGARSELRADGAIGSEPHVSVELYRPLYGPLFASASGALRKETNAFAHDGDIIAEYERVSAPIGVGVGLELGRLHEVRAGVLTGLLRAHVATGDPRLPELSGWETRLEAQWLYDGQDRAVVPTRGTRARLRVTHILSAPDPEVPIELDRSNDGITRTALDATTFWPRGADRVFALIGAGVSTGEPLPDEQFTLGGPLRVGSYDRGELRADHYALVTVGYLRALGRLPDFFGGPIHAGLWLENGSTFDDPADAGLHTSVSAGVVLDTLLGPAALAVSVGDNRRLRPYMSIGGFF